MNKVDKTVKALMLNYPTLYRNRFSALNDVFTSSNYEWDEDGCLVIELHESLLPEAEAIEKSRKRFEERKESYHFETGCGRLNAVKALRDYEFFVENVDGLINNQEIYNF